MFWSVLARINVPLFAMVSGALLLGRNESYNDLWHKRILRILLVIVVFESLIYLEFHMTRSYPISWQDFIYGMFGGTPKNFTSYWFLYAYLGFLLMLPFLRFVAQRMRRSDFFWLMGIHVVFSTLMPTVRFICLACNMPRFAVSDSIAISLSSVGLYFFPLIGYWINKNIDVTRLRRKHWTILVSTTLAGMAFCGMLTYLRGEHLDGYKQDYLGLTAYMTAIAAFLLVKCYALHVQPGSRTYKAWQSTGGVAFGVYLMDQALKLVLYEPLKDLLMNTIGTFTFSWLWCLTSLVICGTTTWLLKQTHFFRKIL